MSVIPNRLAELDLEPGEAGTVERQGGQQLPAVVPAGEAELGQEGDAVQQPHHTVCIVESEWKDCTEEDSDLCWQRRLPAERGGSRGRGPW